MQIEPSETVFAERYGRGQAQVVWTTLVADLETPVSAFLKLGGGKAMSFLLESVEGGDTRGRYSIIGTDPDLIWRARGAQAEINRSPRAKPDDLRALPRAAARGAAHADRGKPHRAARQPAVDGGRRVRLSRLRHGAADGRAAAAQSRSDRHSRRHPGAPDHHRGVRRGEGRDHGGDAGAPGERRRRQDGAQSRGRAAVADPGKPRPAARQVARRSRRRPARR